MPELNEGARCATSFLSDSALRSWLCAAPARLCSEDSRTEQAPQPSRLLRRQLTARARTKLANSAKKTNENFVLNNCRLGSAALVRLRPRRSRGRVPPRV